MPRKITVVLCLSIVVAVAISGCVVIESFGLYRMELMGRHDQKTKKELSELKKAVSSTMQELVAIHQSLAQSDLSTAQQISELKQSLTKAELSTNQQILEFNQGLTKSKLATTQELAELKLSTAQQLIELRRELETNNDNDEKKTKQLESHITNALKLLYAAFNKTSLQHQTNLEKALEKIDSAISLQEEKLEARLSKWNKQHHQEENLQREIARFSEKLDTTYEQINTRLRATKSLLYKKLSEANQRPLLKSPTVRPSKPTSASTTSKNQNIFHNDPESTKTAFL